MDRLAAHVRADLEKIEYPPRAWVPPRIGPDGVPALDVLVVGAGLSGLSIAFGLMRRRVSNILVIDRSPAGKEGPWVTHARMDVLRSPKTLSGPDFGIPNLTYRSWHEARYGSLSWDRLDKIDRRDWMAYLVWYRDLLALPVRNETSLEGIASQDDWLALTLASPEGARTIYARKLVLATGIDGAGAPYAPEEIAALPRSVWSHNADSIDGPGLAGRRIAILGAGASAFDCAVHALQHGAAQVALYARRTTLPHVEVLAWSNFPGFLTSFADLPDRLRWNFMRRMRDLQPPPTQTMFDRAALDPRFELKLGHRLDSARMEGDEIVLVANGAPRRFDRILVATGFRTDLSLRPELAGVRDEICLWRDRFVPPPGEDDEELGRHPYLGAGFQLQSKNPAAAELLGNIHLFNAGAVPSVGPVCNGVTGLKYGTPRVVDAITRDLFLEDADMHYDKLLAFDDRMFDGSADRINGLRRETPAADDGDRAEARTIADRLIADTRRQSAEFPVDLANHLPMVIEALFRLGASPDRMAAYAAHYDKFHAVPALRPAKKSIERDNWRGALGDRTREADYRRFFVDEARRLGGSAAIRLYVPELSRGVGASALHGLMRLAYGALRGDEAEIGAALGYWATTFLPLPEPSGAAASTDDPLETLDHMRADPAFARVEINSPMLWHWIDGVGHMPAFGAMIDRLAVGPGTLDRIAQASLSLYAGSMSFEALHAVTGSHWLRLVAPHMDDPTPLIRHFWQAILSIYPKIGMPAAPDEAQLEEWRRLVPPPAAAIAAAAVASDDEHDHSLVFSAFQEFDRTGDPLYRIVAARRVGLIA
ncbi:questin oxidase family protein [Methylocapsa sp. S129]|uniref:questin oxidase family protein n=1 Tax=Methylocapsa sp. S129 TaxID=1641869 RepID=UPI00131C4143|nr:questin oxidase family protein [Methylocapsa sp. S129]